MNWLTLHCNTTACCTACSRCDLHRAQVRLNQAELMTTALQSGGLSSISSSNNGLKRGPKGEAMGAEGVVGGGMQRRPRLGTEHQSAEGGLPSVNRCACVRASMLVSQRACMLRVQGKVSTFCLHL